MISDLTDRNPNVLYETGLAHALNRDVIMLVQQLLRCGRREPMPLPASCNEMFRLICIAFVTSSICPTMKASKISRQNCVYAFHPIHPELPIMFQLATCSERGSSPQKEKQGFIRLSVLPLKE